MTRGLFGDQYDLMKKNPPILENKSSEDQHRINLLKGLEEEFKKIIKPPPENDFQEDFEDVKDSDRPNLRI